ncbi:MAG: YcnI family protein [Phycicoccus sp.]|nr:YcnI family protein [Phycicoccus sp.]NMM34923.1 YcnI family protein [Phycicoccus sp.]
MTVISHQLLTRPASVASSRVARAGAVAALVGAVVVGTALSASAHVGVHPDVTTAGQGAELTFRVPDESDTANTIKLVLTLPQDRPLTDVSTQPMAGWTATVAEAPLPKPVNVGGATITKAPHTVTWTALPGNKIAPGEYQNFYLATDALPAAGEMVLPVAQYYSDGTVVHWTEPTVAGKPEPEHPAPVFTVTAASASEATATPAAITQASGTNAPAETTTDNTARVLGGIALVVAVVAGGLVLLRRRPKTDVK